ncbi:MAG: hypothetical protein L0154_08345 [Chloroflexi bacterium]|nr:hypothetical protein [Chloroflexota bacterium]
MRRIKPHLFLIAGGVLFIIAGLVFVSTSPATLAQGDGTPSPVGEPPTFLSGIYEDWVNSPHADFTAEAFIHWDEDGEVSDRCARCHSTPGYQDYLGADGTAFGVDGPAPLGSVINCDACHNEVATNLTSVEFPSGVVLEDLGDSARCMVCHQGRSFSGTVDAALAEAGVSEDLNAVSEDLSFINIHYYAAAASLYGSDVHGGYEYAGQRYQMQFQHVDAYDACFECHQPHTLEVRVNECVTCHEDVASVEDVREIRMPGSMIDYDGDGDMGEGIYAEVAGLQEMLYAAIQAYAAEVAGTPIIYDALSHPYFFADTNANGTVDEGEEGYNQFTGKLLQATYNYQVSQKDPGGYVHNAKYHIELLYDSIAMLNEELSTPIDLSAANRDDPGHFNSTGEPFRHWDEDGEVPSTCSKCHTSEGLPFLLENGATIPFEPSDSLACTTCHNAIPEFTLYEVDEVMMPSGVTVTFGEGEANNVCLNCHQGRESTTSVNALIASAGVGPDEVSDALRFRNPHYFAAGATLFGTEAQGGYQYEGKVYNGYFEHERRVNECNECHNEHSLTIRSNVCQECHEKVSSPADVELIRLEPEDVEPIDYDGDGDDSEPIKGEIETIHEALFAGIQNYAATVVGTAIAYDEHAYPYWYIDTNGNGVVDPEEANGENAFNQWTPNLLTAIYNYLWVAKDPGSFAHNSNYIMQLMYDSLEAIGGEEAVATFTRPPAPTSD